LQFKLPGNSKTIQVWVKCIDQKKSKTGFATSFEFLNLKPEDEELIQQFGIPSIKKPEKSNPTARKSPKKILGLTLMVLFLLLPFYYLTKPKIPPALPPEISIQLNSPIPMLSARGKDHILFLTLREEWKTWNQEKKTRVIKNVLREIPALGYKRVQLMDAKGKILGMARVGGQIRFTAD